MRTTSLGETVVRREALAAQETVGSPLAGYRGAVYEGGRATLDVSLPYAVGRKLGAYVELTKPRLSFLVLLVASAGFWLASSGAPDGRLFFDAALGVGLLAGGIFALNQYIERDVDGVMERTRGRPIPTGRIEPVEALWFGLLLSVASIVLLALRINSLSVGLALFTLVTYLFVYTPLKRRSPLGTTLGAIPGAIPPVIGWAAARGSLGWESAALFAILFFWQFPHFHAIGWLYRDDYAKAEIRLWPVIEPDGKAMGRRILLGALLLLPASILPFLLGTSGMAYLAGAVLMGGALLYLGVRMALENSKSNARRLLLATVLYLPVLFVLMVMNK